MRRAQRSKNKEERPAKRRKTGTEESQMVLDITQNVTATVLSELQKAGTRVSTFGTRCTKGAVSNSRGIDAKQLLDNIAKLASAALAPSTKLTYKRAWTTFDTFSGSFKIPNSVPFSVTTVALFVSYLFQEAFSPRTISTYLSAIAYAHKMLNFEDPTRAFVIQKLVAGAYRLGNTFDIRLPITTNILNRLLDVIPDVINDKYTQSLFKALFLFAFSSFARIGELICAAPEKASDVVQLADVTLSSVKGKITAINVCFKKFKHNSNGVPKVISFAHGDCKISAISATTDYLKVRTNCQGPMFVSNTGSPILRTTFDRTLRSCLRLCNLDSSRYKGHSFRIGAATVAADKGLSDAQIRSMGRWHSNAFLKYIRSNM
ncbi:uncharacterized protein LOC134232331 [Saccostrea cucullata]|uniref:uncharacterized protein LOC134232331 n=1 Tax=Saccostrea cuccullata TaxID=36930 RepID=UPI002ED1AA7C